MQMLIDASLPRSTADWVRRFGHEVRAVRDIGLGTASDNQIARYAKDNGLALLTADFDFADVRIYPPTEYSGIVVIERPQGATISVVRSMIERLLNEPTIIQNLIGRLVIVAVNRIRVRPAILDGPA